MRRIERIEAAVRPDCLSQIKGQLGTVISGLKSDYFPDIGEDEFLEKLQKESIVSRVLSYRFCDMENIGRLDGNRPRHHTAVIGHMTKHRRPGNMSPLLKDRYQYQPVR